MSVGSVSTSTLSSILQNTVTRLQSQLSTVSTESSTGLLADIGQTLGAQSGQDISMHAQMADLSAISSSNAIVSTRLDTASNALTSLQTSAQSVLTQLIGASSSSSGSSGSTGALGLQQAATAALGAFASTMNSEVGGNYVFGGINSGAAPIAAYASGGAAETAVDNAFQATFGMSISSSSVSTISGAAMTSFLTTQFAALFTGSNWTSTWSSASDTAQTSRIGVNQTATTSVSANQPAFQNMAQALTMVSALGGLNLSSDAYSALIGQARSVISSANNGLIETAASVGTMQSQVTQANSAITLQQNLLTKQINSEETVNSYQVASQVSNLSTQLQTAYSLTAQIAKLSLVKFL
jgi:flagellar hook-associated protein 3 FlgL